MVNDFIRKCMCFLKSTLFKEDESFFVWGLESWAGILVQVTINRRLLIGRDGHLDQSEAYDLS